VAVKDALSMISSAAGCQRKKHTLHGVIFRRLDVYFRPILGMVVRAVSPNQSIFAGLNLPSRPTARRNLLSHQIAAKQQLCYRPPQDSFICKHMFLFGNCELFHPL
jgi:hypothetical protein